MNAVPVTLSTCGEAVINEEETESFGYKRLKVLLPAILKL